MAYKLLVVDDDRDTVETIKARLLKEGYEVETASDGEEALVKLKEYNADIVILDLVMPKLNGYEVLKQIREKYKDKWRPVIIVSADSELESFKKCHDLEADHYITKPFTFDDLLRAIKVMISLIPSRIS